MEKETYINKEEIVPEVVEEVKEQTLDKDAPINFYANQTMKDVNGNEVVVPIVVESVSINMLESRLHMAISQKMMAERQIEETEKIIADTQNKLDKVYEQK